MNYNNDKKEIIFQKLRKVNLKVTPQRMIILSELIDNYDHPTADAIYQKIRQKLPNISFDTVNRTLITFSQNGIIKITEGRSGSRRYDPVTELHHHFHCIRCNKIIDFSNKEYDRIKLPESIKNKHQVLGKKIILDGVCQNCKKKENNKGRE